MSSEVTITITVGGGAVPSVAGAVASSATSSVPEPVDLDELQAAGIGETPSPLEPADLAAARGEGVSSPGAGLPTPLPVEQLSVGSAQAAPAPADVASLASASGGPPTPMSIEDLEAAGGAENAKPTTRAASRTKESKR